MRKADIARRNHEQAGILEQVARALLEWILELLKSGADLNGTWRGSLAESTGPARHQTPEKYE